MTVREGGGTLKIGRQPPAVSFLFSLDLQRRVSFVPRKRPETSLAPGGSFSQDIKNERHRH